MSTSTASAAEPTEPTDRPGSTTTNSAPGAPTCAAAGCSRPALDRDLLRHGVQLSEYEIISMLSEQPDRRLRMSALADMVVQSRSRLTHTASRLEKRGWVQREACVGDRRGVELVLTPEGLDAITAMARVHVASVARAPADT